MINHQGTTAMTKQLTLDEMLECLITINHPAARTCQAVIETIGTAMAERIATALGVTCGPAAFEGTAFAGTCAPFRPAFEGQPAPHPLSLYDPEEWEESDLPMPPACAGCAVQKFTVETTYRKPFFRHRVYEAQSPEDACRQALADSGYESEQPDDETAGAPYVTGLWPGEDTYKAPSLSIPSAFAETIQQSAQLFGELLAALHKAPDQPRSPEHHGDHR
jgi:hypothetical protein